MLYTLHTSLATRVGRTYFCVHPIYPPYRLFYPSQTENTPCLGAFFAVFSPHALYIKRLDIALIVLLPYSRGVL